MPGGMKGPAGDRVRDNDGSLDIEGPFGGDGPPAGSKRTRRFVPFEKWDRLVKRYDDQFKDDDEEVENPGYPFTGENWDKTPFGITEPKWSNAAEARSAMIYQMGFDSWTDYKDVYSNAERKSHWDDNPNLWTSFEMYP